MPMFFMLFLIAVSQGILRNLKDTLVITGKGSGAEVIPFLKVWVMLPMAILFTVMYTRLARRWPQQRLFQVIISFFVIFFLLFGFVLFPNIAKLHPHGLADSLQSILPEGLRGFVAMLRNWTFTLFYGMSEMWGSIVLTVLFWGFANEVTRLDEAPRFYAIFGVAGNLAAIGSGQVANLLTSETYQAWMPVGSTAWEQSLMRLVLFVAVSGFGAIFSFRYLQNHGIGHQEMKRQTRPEKPRLSFSQSLGYLRQSKYLRSIAVIVVGYGLSINLVEVVWKAQLKELYPNPIDYNVYNNNLTTILGITSTCTALMMPGMVRMFGWTFIALLTPVMLLLTSGLFFTALFSEGTPLAGLLYGTLTNPLTMVVFFGAVQNVVSKAGKYSAFDMTKEMAFIPLSTDVRLTGKAAIDGIGSRLGKSGGAVVHQCLLLIFVTLTNSAPYIAMIVGLVGVLWCGAVISVGRQFKEEEAKAPQSVASA